MTNEDIRNLWISKGGSFHGPRVETGTMPESALLQFLRELIEPGQSKIDHSIGVNQRIIELSKNVFEQEYANLHMTGELCLTKYENGEYIAWSTQSKWKEWNVAWQACLAFSPHQDLIS